MLILLQAAIVPPVCACFGDKLGIGFVKSVEGEFAANLIAIYIKEKTGIDSVVNEFNKDDAAIKSYKKNETDIIVWVTSNKLQAAQEGSVFFPLLEYGDNSGRIFLEASKKRLEDIKFFTLNKVMEQVGKLITDSDFKKVVSLVKDGKKFSKQAAREYLLEKDMI